MENMASPIRLTNPPKFYQHPPLDLKIDEWQSLASIGLNLQTSVKRSSAELTDAISAFITNTLDYCSLSMLAGGLFASARKFQLAETAACWKLHNKHTPDPPPGFTYGPVPQDVADLRNQYYEERSTEPPPFRVIGVSSTKEAFEVASRFDQVRFITLMKSQIISCWSTFEVLAGDLWIACLNAKPKLGFKALGADELPGDDDDARERKRNIKFQLRIWELEKVDYDVKHNMGNLLQSKWVFARKEGLEDAYRKVFRNDQNNDISKIEAIFRDPTLNILHAVRNLLVHKAGVVDAEFQKSSAQNHPRFKDVSGGDTIPLDGTICVELIKAGCECSLKLLKFVDDWMVANS